MSERAISKIPKLLEARFGVPDSKARPLLECLVITILSQNTNDRLRDRAYARLRERFETWDEIDAAREEDVAEAIAVAGLANQKSRTIKRLLAWARGWNHDLAHLCGEPPEEIYEILTRIKGIGDKTAKVCLLFSCGMPFFPVDTHINRVSKRLGLAGPRDTREAVSEKMQAIFPPETYYSLHINLIQLGRELCKPRQPRCHDCPLLGLCQRVGVESS